MKLKVCYISSEGVREPVIGDYTEDIEIPDDTLSVIIDGPDKEILFVRGFVGTRVSND
jgi:hypothetical protein